MIKNTPIDYTNSVVGIWKVLDFSHHQCKVRFWNATCLLCNAEGKVSSKVLARKYKHCFNCREHKGGSPQVYSAESNCARRVFYQYKSSAKTRGYSFDIDFKTFMEYLKHDCYFCGKGPSSHVSVNGHIFYYTGLDRVDNSKGYQNNNIIPCCRSCNTKKAAISPSMVASLYSLMFESGHISKDDFLFDPFLSFETSL